MVIDSNAISQIQKDREFHKNTHTHTRDTVGKKHHQNKKLENILNNLSWNARRRRRRVSYT